MKGQKPLFCFVCRGHSWLCLAPKSSFSCHSVMWHILKQNFVGFKVKLTAIFCSFLFVFGLGDWNACQFCPAALLLLGETSFWDSIELWVQRSSTPQGTIKGFHSFTKVRTPSRRGCFYLENSVFCTLIGYCGTTQCPLWPYLRLGWTLLWDASSLSHRL